MKTAAVQKVSALTTAALITTVLSALLAVTLVAAPSASAQRDDARSAQRLGPDDIDFELPGDFEVPAPVGSIAMTATSTSSAYWGVSPIVWMQYTVTNTGNVPFHDLEITEDYGTWAKACDDRRLAPGASTYCWSFTFRQQNVQTIRSIATATTNGGVDISTILTTTHRHFDLEDHSAGDVTIAPPTNEIPDPFS